VEETVLSGAKILIVDDDPKICQFLADLLDSIGHVTVASQSIAEARQAALANRFDLVLLDLDLPDGNGLTLLPELTASPGKPEVIIVTGTGNTQGAKIAFKYGAWDFIQKPFTMEEVSLPIKRAMEYRHEKISAHEPIALKRTGIIGNSHSIQCSLNEVARASITEVSVLITGETGTGKELFARAIHDNSRRAAGSFVAVDCGAIPETLAEANLFGYEKGVFTGADSRRDGLILQAESGTLFLDEIGDLALPIQKALLRALQEKKIRPIGGRETTVDFRLVSATNRDLNQLVREEKFREDLLYRIRAIEISLPPLRLREGDIGEIVVQKIHQLSSHYGPELKGISTEFMTALIDYDWPGNIRELINVLEFALASAGSDPVLHPKHLPPEYRASFLDAAPQLPASVFDLNGGLNEPKDPFPTLSLFRENLEKQYLEVLVKKARGNRETALRLSGISQARLYGLLKKYRLSLLKPS
jgi:two-component system, NtrC family, response regulator